MNVDDLKTIALGQADRSIDRVLSENLKYAPTDNVFHQLNLSAQLQHVTPRQALMGMAIKSITQVTHMGSTTVNYSESDWDKALTDSISYLFLLRALVVGEKTGDATADEARAKIDELRKRLLETGQIKAVTPTDLSDHPAGH